MKTTSKKNSTKPNLSVGRETLRRLDKSALQYVVGGVLNARCCSGCTGTNDSE